MPPSSVGPRRGRAPVVVVVSVCLVVALVAAGFLWYRLQRPAGPAIAALQANNRGIGYMEQFEYWKAATAFEDAVRQAPDWQPARINLAIALLNTDDAGNLGRASDIFTEILRNEPENPYAHFCLGIILRYQSKTEEAAPHFEAVTRIDPQDAAAWYWLGSLLPEEQEGRILECFEKAHRLNPYLRGPIYGLAMKYRANDPKKAEALLDEMKKLDDATWINLIDIKYTEMGRYAEVIGRVPDATPPAGPLPLFLKDDKFAVKLAGQARWVGTADLRGEAAKELLARVRQRFGGILVPLDYNRDDKPDLLLLGAVVDDGRIRDLLLRNDGDGRFTDVTAEAGLSGPRTSLACCVADFDNDGYADVVVTSAEGVYLFRNNQKGHFDDVTGAAGLGAVDAVCLGAAFADLDQDGDLDLVLCPHTSRAGLATGLTGRVLPPPITLAVYLNVGEAPPVQPDQNPPPLKPAFKKVEGRPTWLGKLERWINVVVTDLDRDGDLDLLLLADSRAAVAVLNDRLLQFHRQATPPEWKQNPAENWSGGMVLDANLDGVFDLLMIGPGAPAELLLGQPLEGEQPVGPRYLRDSASYPSYLQARPVDLDLDGFMDVLGLSADGKPQLLHNNRGRLTPAREGLGRDGDWPAELFAVSGLDCTGDGFPDLLLWSPAGLELRASQGNGNHSVRVQPVGQRRVDKHKMRTNADGIGTVVTVQTDNRWSSLENTTLDAGLGQSRQPLLFGLGQATQADVVRLRWPDNTRQAEFGQPGVPLMRIEESNRKPTSCPVLFAWDGSRFTFVTDFLGAGSLGERQPDGTTRPPRAEESVKIESHQLRPRDGKYVLRLAEPMDEVTYLDRLQLVVLDHPADVQVYPDERLATTGPAPTQELLAFRGPIYPRRAADQQRRDVTETLRHQDRRTVDGYARRSWLGVAEEHAVEFDFGDQLSEFGPQDRLVLCLAGWTDYAYPESIWAATQAGVSLQPPVLERKASDGRWEKVAEIGFPAGMPRMMTFELTGKLAGPACVLRLRTNLEVYWDQIFVAPLLASAGDGPSVRVTPLEVAAATLSARGCVQEYSPDGREPTLYDYDRLATNPVTRLKGQLTRFGDVAELLRRRDDRFVIFGPGDEVEVQFAADRLPPLPPGWVRSFVLRTWGYCKDCGPFTATGDTVEPLPFAAMKCYPYGPEQQYPVDAAHDDYRRRYNTRTLR